MRSENLGFEKDHVLMIPIYEQEVMRKGEAIKGEWILNEKVISACLTSFFPGKNQWYQNYWYEGASEDSYLMMNWIAVDHDFLDTFQVELTQGRNFLESSQDDVRGGYILNEAAVEEIGWQNPIGKQFRIIGDGAVIGVVKDFHFTSLHRKIVPMALFMYPSGFEYFSVRIRPYDVENTLNFLRAKWTELTSSQYFEYSFLDEDYDNLYRTEMRLSKILGTVTFLSIFIACLGLFGLASFIVERRTKEIGIRKVLGAPLSKIMLILTKEFALWVLAANIIAWPVAYYFMFRWLQNFAYRIPINLLVFLFSGASALGVALLTVSYQAIKATLADPVKTLRYE
jgi:putative ABC transport system permease protein